MRHENIVKEEYKLADSTVLKTGDKFKIKAIKGTFIFCRYVYNFDRDVAYIDCIDKYGQLKSIYPSDIKGPAKVTKRSRSGK